MFGCLSSSFLFPSLPALLYIMNELLPTPIFFSWTYPRIDPVWLPQTSLASLESFSSVAFLNLIGSGSRALALLLRPFFGDDSAPAKSSRLVFVYLQKWEMHMDLGLGMGLHGKQRRAYSCCNWSFPEAGLPGHGNLTWQRRRHKSKGKGWII